MLIAQLTDLHIKKDGKLAYKKVDTLKCLRNAVEHINHLIPLPDMVIITGDLGDFGLQSEYQLLIPELKRLKPTVKMIPGNHDNRHHLRESFQGWIEFDTPSDCNFTHDAGEFQLLGLDTSVPGKPYGMLSPHTLDWLDNQLKAAQRKSVLLFMHHPPVKVGLNHMDVQNLQNSDALQQVLQRYAPVAGIITGHIHRPVFTTWNRIPVWIGPSHSHAVSLDLTPEAPPSFSIEPGAIQLFRLKRESICSHISYINAVDGPYPFFDKDNRLIN